MGFNSAFKVLIEALFCGNHSYRRRQVSRVSR